MPDSWTSSPRFCNGLLLHVQEGRHTEPNKYQGQTRIQDVALLTIDACGVVYRLELRGFLNR